ncbi:MAG TPA: inositol-phosphate phosphatase [Herpetosiphon sp.]|uniref:inositol-phosphate phosphatase n=1 Tax=Herpetosiphon aurantiacus (strain ATCC 23779 / DSM 785 / 114-95) TaxID=316274 RepID=A9AZW3_HERA2|nr:inositol monophosphatase family protein [Herpetosiphon sp.]ABX07167.1 Inositol-phosphate phosphatase [Herpetosiphon aurantiacus DSM 785]HBW51088.1 inositol-phosphate phosphatase [Herpetosiphon sp.]
MQSPNEAQLMETWARQAGAYALDIFHDYNAAAPRRKADNSWVTEVDETIEQMLRQHIAQAFPDDLIMGEEGGGQASNSGRIWVLDPIDGTGSFVKRLPVWCVSIGLLVDGYPAAGCVYLPVLDECYLAGLTGDATLNGQIINAENPDFLDSQSWMAVPSNAHRRYKISYPGKTRSLGSTAANVCYVASSRACAAILGNASLWDIAGAWPILERAGGKLSTFSGGPFDWQRFYQGASANEPLFAASNNNYANMRAMIDLAQGAI